MDASGAILYGTPTEGSGYEYLVTNTVPYDFSVVSGSTTEVNLEVVSLDDVDGIESFGFGGKFWVFGGSNGVGSYLNDVWYASNTAQ